MKNKFFQLSIASAAIILLSVATCGILVSSQQKPLTLDNIFAGLNPGKTTPNTNTVGKRNSLLIKWVKERQVDFPLTTEIEKSLRSSGANDELINVIRRNSPPVKAVPTPTPEFFIKEVFVTPTPTPRSQLPTYLNFKLPNSVTMEMVKIPAGSFIMGSPESEKYRASDEKQYSEKYRTSDEKQHKVTISKDFYLGKYEVTQSQWKAVMENNNPSSFKGDNLPVENVSWDDAKKFISKLNNDNYEFGLPSEAEWEYAARAGTTTAFYFGDSLSSAQANFDGNYPYGNASKGKYLEKTTYVGNYSKNDFGLYDMHGNVWEWCEDIYESDYGKLRADGSANVSVGDSSLRVLRGGSWGNDGFGVRSADRDRISSDARLYFFGFRVAARVK